VVDKSVARQAGDQSSPQVYAGQVPAGPVDLQDYADFTPEENPAKKRWVWIGCGCLVLLCIVTAIGAYAFDTLNLYCTTFNPSYLLTIIISLFQFHRRCLANKYQFCNSCPLKSRPCGASYIIDNNFLRLVSLSH
jgi:hypothetical protein